MFLCYPYGVSIAGAVLSRSSQGLLFWSRAASPKRFKQTSIGGLDALDPPVAGAILFTGSSSIRRYEQLTRDFADYHVIQRGFGGSQFEDLNGFVDDIVIPYQPGAIVVFEGTNDTASGESSAEVFADYQGFVNLIHTARPGIPIFFLGIAATPGRFDCCQARRVTRAVRRRTTVCSSMGCCMC